MIDMNFVLIPLIFLVIGYRLRMLQISIKQKKNIGLEIIYFIVVLIIGISLLYYSSIILKEK